MSAKVVETNAAVTPKKRVRSDDCVVNSLAGQVSDTTDRDRLYVKTQVDELDNNTVQLLAQWMRDGVLTAAVKKANAAKPATALGRVLPSKFKKIGSAPPYLIQAFLDETCAEVITEPPNNNDDDDDDGYVVTQDTGLKLMQFALNKKLDVETPAKHAAVRWSNAMLLVLKAQAHAMGDRLKSVTRACVKSGAWGYFDWDGKVQENMTLVPRVGDVGSITVQMAKDFVELSDDLKLVDNHSHDARLASKTSGFECRLMPILRIQRKVTYPSEESAFEFEQAADTLKPMLASVASEDGGKASGASKPKGKAAPKASPKKSPQKARGKNKALRAPRA